MSNKIDFMKLQDIVTFSQGIQVPVEEQFEKQKDNHVRFLRIVDYTRGDVEPRYIDDPGSKYAVQSNDVIMIRYGEAGRVVRGYEGVIANNLFKITPNNDCIDKDFLYYSLTSDTMYKKIANTTQTTGMPAVNFKNLYGLEISLPQLKEQKKIAEILSSVDAAIEKTEQVIAKTEEVKKGLMQQLLTKGIGHTEFKQTEIGEIPVDWKVEILGDISTITRLAGAEYTDYWNPIEDGNIIALRGYNIGRNKLILDNVEKISDDLSNKLYRSKLFIDDIVFPCVGTIGKAAVIYEDNKFHINQNIAKITPNPNIKSEYLVRYLMSDNIRSEILKYNTSTSQPNVLVGNLRKFKIIVPSVDEQQMIASILNNYDKKIDIEFKKLEVLKDLKRGLMQQLLTGKTRVKEATMYSFLKELGYCE